MFSFFINNCLKKPPTSEKNRRGEEDGVKEASEEAKNKESGDRKQQQMTINEKASEGGGGVGDQDQDEHLCCSAPDCLGLIGTTSTPPHHRQHQGSNDSKPKMTMTMTTTRISRSNFAKSTTTSLFPNTQFTNHESLPRLSDAMASFNQAYPQYKDTQEADRIRQRHYSHLSHHVCLDYTGFTLFSHSQLQPTSLAPPFFGISHKSAGLASRVHYGIDDDAQERGEGEEETTAGLFESAMRNRIMSFLNVSPEEYTMVCTANRTSAFKLLVEAYPFHSGPRLLTVYDYESEAVGAMHDCALKRGAKVMSATFSWPNLRIQSSKLKKMLTGNNSDRKKRGLFVFPLQSRMSGTRYPYLWMRFAQEKGWNVVLDACALGPKELDTFGLSLIRPDFIVSSFYKVVGADPSGFAGLLVKKSSPILDRGSSAMGTSAINGVVSIVPPTTFLTRATSTPSQGTDDAADLSAYTSSDIDAATSSSTCPMPSCPQVCNVVASGGSESKGNDNAAVGHRQIMAERMFEQGETSCMPLPLPLPLPLPCQSSTTPDEIVEVEGNIIPCLGLDHADSLGLLLISGRLRYITNWLVIALSKLRHPNSETDGHPLVRIYGPRIKFERGPSVAFNVFDWKGEKVEPALVQKLADRFNISLGCGFLHNICFSDKYAEEGDAVLESRSALNTRGTTPAAASGTATAGGGGGNNKRKLADRHGDGLGIAVVNASLGFQSNFEDAYKLWSFVARFLDADFVEKERWRYLALNQKMIEV